MRAPSSYAAKIWVEAIADRRGAVEKLLFPLLLALPFVLVKPLLPHWAAALGFLTLFIGVMGGAVVLSRERREGMFGRLTLLPHGSGRYALEFAGASAVVDFVQLIPTFVLLHLGTGGVHSLVHDLFVLALATFVANLVGTLVGFAAESGGQVHLYGALASFAVAYFSGLLSQQGLAALTRWFFSVRMSGSGV